jgi:hypothetical protein
VAPQAPGLPESPLLARAGPPQAPGPAKRPHPPRPSGQGGTDPEPDARASGEGSEGVKRARRHERAPQGLPAQEASSPSADAEAAERPDEEEAPAAPQGRKDDPVRRALAEAPAAPRSRKDEAAQDEALKKKTLEEARQHLTGGRPRPPAQGQAEDGAATGQGGTVRQAENGAATGQGATARIRVTT